MAALGLEPLSVTVRFSSGALYDYVVLGEHPKATDGFDNAYDTISPGNLNADMGEPYISAVLPHPEWKPGRELRGDLRALAGRQRWQVSVSSSLAKGTPLSVALQPGHPLPSGVKLTLKDPQSAQETDLRSGNATLPAPGPGASATLFISAEQP